jgi:hypothetical protein
MHTLHPTIPDGQINLSRHELGHAWMAAFAGYYAEGIELDQGHGACEVVFPMAPDTFEQHYQESPLSTAAALTRILATIRIGTYCEVVAGQYGQELREQDLQDTENWRSAVVPVYGADGWNRVYASVYQTIQSWYRRPGVQQVFAEAAPAIAMQKRLSRYALLTLLEVAGAGLVPAPCFDTVLPPARREPSRQSVATPRAVPVAVAAPPARDIVQSVLRAIKSGDFVDTQGRPRMPSTAELAYLRQVQKELRAGKTVPGLDA